MVKADEPIKEEGKAGLRYAYNRMGEYIAAEDAINGQIYTCPLCGCKMHLTTTKYGKPLFARNPDTEHLTSECYTQGKRIVHSFKGLVPEDWIASLCCVTSRRKGPGHDDGGHDGGDSDHGGPRKGRDKDDFKETGFRSLKQLHESGIEHLNPDDKQGNYKVSDFIMTYKYGMKFFSNPNFILGSRIVYARFLIHTKDNALLFLLFDGKSTVRFRLLFANKHAQFIKMRDRFGKYVELENGTTGFKKHYDQQNVLIASDDWRKIDKTQCYRACGKRSQFCSNCLGLYQARYTNDKQIYLCPSDH